MMTFTTILESRLRSLKELTNDVDKAIQLLSEKKVGKENEEKELFLLQFRKELETYGLSINTFLLNYPNFTFDDYQEMFKNNDQVIHDMINKYTTLLHG